MNNNIEENLEKLEENNNCFIEEKLIEYKDYFDNLFTNVGEKIVLDEEQRRIILCDDDYSLVNAGAGSGKSTTMAGKVKYLVDKLGVNPKEIIMLSFTKKSSEDLNYKVNELLKLGIPVSTFHSLGYKFIKKIYSYPIEVIDDNDKKELLRQYFKDLFKDKEKLKRFVELFSKYKNDVYIEKGFIENFNKFDTFEEYFEDYKRRKYLEESKKKNGIHKYIERRIGNRKSVHTIRGEITKSVAERRIADYLYVHNIDYNYEKFYEEKIDEDVVYHPDFTIDNLGNKIYIEYFGLSNCFTTNNRLIKREQDKYNRIRKIKEEYQRSHDGDFINLDNDESGLKFMRILPKELEKRGMVLKRKTDDEIFYECISSYYYSEIYKLIEFLDKFLSLYKNMLIDEDYEMVLFDRRIEQIENEEIKIRIYSEDDIIEKEKKKQAIELLKDVFKYYQDYMLRNHLVDYDDMINKTYQYLAKGYYNDYSKINYRYIIVDEYQDITFQRLLFIKKLLQYYNAKLLSVGDDWQSIYSFDGSRLELFNRFSDFITDNNEKELANSDLFISTTYRYGQELADISGEFILKNKEQIRKELKAIKKLKNPIEIVEIDNTEDRTIFKLIERIYKDNPDDFILLLARTNRAINRLSYSNYFKKGFDDIVVCNEYPDAKIETLTMHRSKGLTADQVIIFGLREDTFPSKGRTESWVFDYFHLDKIKEMMPYAEERRLFYVALTRTKNKVYLVVPQSVKEQSEFIFEIRRMIEEKE